MPGWSCSLFQLRVPVILVRLLVPSASMRHLLLSTPVPWPESHPRWKPAASERGSRESGASTRIIAAYFFACSPLRVEKKAVLERTLFRQPRAVFYGASRGRTMANIDHSSGLSSTTLMRRRELACFCVSRRIFRQWRRRSALGKASRKNSSGRKLPNKRTSFGEKKRGIWRSATQNTTSSL